MKRFKNNETGWIYLRADRNVQMRLSPEDGWQEVVMYFREKRIEDLFIVTPDEFAQLFTEVP